jgi:hypothetical protein
MLVNDAFAGVKQNFVPPLPACPPQLNETAKLALKLLLQTATAGEKTAPSTLI